MNDHPPTTTAPAPHQVAGGHYKLTTTVLWIALAGGMVLNIGLQSAGLWVLAVPFGLLALGSAAGLVARAIVTGKRR
ncbi:hypothetical protein GCM10009830_48390 [Glycomyces endophyticus]|uniref:DUF3188 domain-containing protein n=1 Tax=Glycomyces endophyticus TaxID=480996 RepID=A0ABP4TZH0_9ACTN